MMQFNSKTNYSQNDKFNQHSFKKQFQTNLDIVPTWQYESSIAATH